MDDVWNMLWYTDLTCEICWFKSTDEKITESWI